MDAAWYLMLKADPKIGFMNLPPQINFMFVTRPLERSMCVHLIFSAVQLHLVTHRLKVYVEICNQRAIHQSYDPLDTKPEQNYSPE